MSKYSTFEDFMQAAINKVEFGFQNKYGKSVFSMMNGAKEESEIKFAKIIQKSLNGPHKYEQRFYAWKESGQNMDPLLEECVSSIMLNVIMSNIFNNEQI